MIGRVVKAHGIRGEVVVEPRTDVPEQRFAPGTVVQGKQGGRTRELTVTAMRPHQGRLLITFAEIADRTAAESLRSTTFFAPPREDDEGFYDHDLEGLRVLQDGADIGEVTGVTHVPGRLLLEVTINSGKEVLIPFVEDIVPDVDLDSGMCVITPPEGLLEL